MPARSRRALVDACIPAASAAAQSERNICDESTQPGCAQHSPRSIAPQRQTERHAQEWKWIALAAGFAAGEHWRRAFSGGLKNPYLKVHQPWHFGECEVGSLVTR